MALPPKIKLPSSRNGPRIGLRRRLNSQDRTRQTGLGLRPTVPSIQQERELTRNRRMRPVSDLKVDIGRDEPLSLKSAFQPRAPSARPRETDVFTESPPQETMLHMPQLSKRYNNTDFSNSTAHDSLNQNTVGTCILSSTSVFDGLSSPPGLFAEKHPRLWTPSSESLTSNSESDYSSHVSSLSESQSNALRLGTIVATDFSVRASRQHSDDSWSKENITAYASPCVQLPRFGNQRRSGERPSTKVQKPGTPTD